MNDLPSSTLPPAGSLITNRLRELQHRLEHSHQPDTGPRDEGETCARIIQALQLEDASTHLQRQLHESELNVKGLRKALDRANDNLGSRKQKIQKLSKELEDYLYKSRMRKKLITQKNGKIEQQEAQIEQQEAQIEQQQARIEQQEAQIEQQQARIEQQRARIKELEGESRRRARHTGALKTGKSEQDGRVATLRVEVEDKKGREKDRNRKSARATASSQTHVPDARGRRQQRMHQEDHRVAASSPGTKRHHRRWF